MNFWWLFSLFLLVPVLVHLFAFRKSKKVFFSNTRFLKNFSSKNQTKSRLKRLLILTNRVLFFGLLVLVLGQMLPSADPEMNQNSAISIYLDKSISSNSAELESFVNSFVSLLDDRQDQLFFIEDFSSERLSMDRLAEKPSVWESYFRNEDPNRVLAEMESNENLLFSDFGAWSENSLSQIRSDTARMYSLIYTGRNTEEINVFVDTLFLMPNADDKNRRKVTLGLRSSGASGETSMVVRLLKGNRQISSLVVDVAQEAEVIFDLEATESGTFAIEIDGDQFVEDNRFLFAIGQESLPKVAILDQTKVGYVSKVFENRNLFSARNLDASNIDFEELNRSDLLVTAALDELPEGIFEQFPDLFFVIFPGEEFQESQLPIQIERPADPYGLREIDLDFTHPLFDRITDAEFEDTSMPEAEPLGEISGAFESIIKYRGGLVFLAKSKNIYFFNALSQGENAGFYTHALFLPILYQLAFDAKKINETLYYLPGDYISLAERTRKNPFVIRGEDYEAIPGFNSLEDGTLLEIPQDIPPGVFHVMRATDTLKTVCINIPKSESEASPWSLKYLTEFFAQASHVRVVDLSDITPSELVRNESESIPFWKYTLLLALLFIVLETMLHRYLK